MLRPIKHFAARLRLAIPIAAVVGAAAASLVGVAVAKSFTLQVAKNATVTNAGGMSSSENIVVNTRGHAVYDLSGDSQHHPKCTKANGCFQFWAPVTVASAKKLTKAPGINGKLGTWHRDGFLQVTLGGHPLYTFAEDRRRDAATGEGLRSFGGTWHVIKAAVAAGGTTTTTSTTTTTPVMTTCVYQPCY